MFKQVPIYLSDSWKISVHMSLTFKKKSGLQVSDSGENFIHVYKTVEKVETSIVFNNSIHMSFTFQYLKETLFVFSIFKNDLLRTSLTLKNVSYWSLTEKKSLRSYACVFDLKKLVYFFWKSHSSVPDSSKSPQKLMFIYIHIQFTRWLSRGYLLSLERIEL